MATNQRVTRRKFIRRGMVTGAGMAALANLGLPAAEARDEDSPLPLRIGLVTDLHYADKPPAGTRYYRETAAKLAEAARQWGEKKIDLIVELGDLIDSADSLDREKGFLRRMAKEFAAIPGQHHYVLGNHCVSALTKPEFLEIVGQEKSHYSFDTNGIHCIVLDACFRSDGEPYGRNNFEWTDSNVPPAEVEWLRSDLRQTPHKAVVFVHQRLDAEPPYGVRNAAEIRRILEESGKVLAVLQGHYHPGAYNETGGIRYLTLRALVEGSGEENGAYAILEILPGHRIRLQGFRQQKGYE